MFERNIKGLRRVVGDPTGRHIEEFEKTTGPLMV
jgi:hypothetical protein